MLFGTLSFLRHTKPGRKKRLGIFERHIWLTKLVYKSRFGDAHTDLDEPWSHFKSADQLSNASCRPSFLRGDFPEGEFLVVEKLARDTDYCRPFWNADSPVAIRWQKQCTHASAIGLHADSTIYKRQYEAPIQNYSLPAQSICLINSIKS